MWNQDNYAEDFFKEDRWGRFKAFGIPPSSSADWAWVQHIAASLMDGGRACVVLDTGAVSRGSLSKNANKEKTIRSRMIEADLIEGVVLLPDNLFYNTTAPGILVLLRRHKPAERARKLILVNSSAHYVKRKPKNELTSEGIAAIADVIGGWESRPKLSRVLTIEQLREVDYNLGPSQFVNLGDVAAQRPLEAIMADLNLGASPESGKSDPSNTHEPPSYSPSNDEGV